MSLLFDAMLANRRRNDAARQSTAAAPADAGTATAALPPAGKNPQQSVDAMVEAAPTLMFVQAPEDTQIAMIADEDLTVMRIDDEVSQPTSSVGSQTADPNSAQVAAQAAAQAATQQQAIAQARAAIPPTSTTLDLGLGDELNLDDLDLQLPSDEELAKMLSEDPELAALGLDTPSSTANDSQGEAGAARASAEPSRSRAPSNDPMPEQGPEMPMTDDAGIMEFGNDGAPKAAGNAPRTASSQGAQQYAGFEDGDDVPGGPAASAGDPFYIDPSAAAADNPDVYDGEEGLEGEAYDEELAEDEGRRISNKQWVLAGLGVLAVAAGAVAWKMFDPLDLAPAAIPPVLDAKAPAVTPAVAPALTPASNADGGQADAQAASQPGATLAGPAGSAGPADGQAAPGTPAATADAQASAQAAATPAAATAPVPAAPAPAQPVAQTPAANAAISPVPAQTAALDPTAKAAVKEPAKDVNKDLSNKELSKDPSKELSKDLSKDASKEPIKASAKDLLKEPAALPAGSPGRAKTERPDSPLPQALAPTPERKPAMDDARLVAKPAGEPKAPAGKDAAATRAPSSESQTALLDKAWEALERGDLTLAQKSYELATLQDKRSVDAWVGRGATAQKLGRLGEAEQSFKRALELDPRNSYAQAGLAQLRGQADPKRAESDLRSINNREGSLPSTSFSLGNQLAAQGRWQEAQQAYFQAYTGDPGHPDYLVNLAISLDHLRQPGQALQFYRKALTAAQTRTPSFNPQQIQKRVDKLSGTAAPASQSPAAQPAAQPAASADASQ